MSLFENFPYTNFHELNLDWIVALIEELKKKVDIASISKITLADPLQWDITSQYEAYTVVMNNNNAYLSMQPVPYGISISNEEYWQKIFDLSIVFTGLKRAVSFNDDGASPTSSAARLKNSLVWLNDSLYKVKEDISLGTVYSDENVEETSIEIWVDALIQSINNLIDSLDNSIDELEERTTAAREFILVGDSFGGGTDGDNPSQAVPGGGWINRFATATAGWAHVYNNQVPLGGVYGFASSRPFLDVLQDAEQSIPDKTKITDIVVLGGTNDIGKSASAIETAIQAFVSYCHTNYPHARVAIGPIGSRITKMCTEIHEAYRTCLKYGAEYISDLRGLMSLCKYIGNDGLHLNQQGYEYYAPFVTEAILTGHSEWLHVEATQEVLNTINTDFSRNHSDIRLTYMITNSAFRIGLCGTNTTDGIANILPVDYSSTEDTLVCSQNVVKCILPYVRLQSTIPAVEPEKVGEFYMYESGNIYIKRPYGMSTGFNGLAVTKICTIPY